MMIMGSAIGRLPPYISNVTRGPLYRSLALSDVTNVTNTSALGVGSKGTRASSRAVFQGETQLLMILAVGFNNIVTLRLSLSMEHSRESVQEAVKTPLSDWIGL